MIQEATATELELAEMGSQGDQQGTRAGLIQARLAEPGKREGVGAGTEIMVRGGAQIMKTQKKACNMYLQVLNTSQLTGTQLRLRINHVLESHLPHPVIPARETIL